MIFEAIIDVFVGFVKFVIGLFPTSNPPGWFSSTSESLSTVWSYGAGLGAWIPWGIVGSVVTAVLSCVVIGLTIKLARIVASFFTMGGGSAA